MIGKFIAAVSSAFLFLGIAAVLIGEVAPTHQELSTSKQQLPRSILQLLSDAHKRGSLVYRGECSAQGDIKEIYFVLPTTSPLSLDQGLARIQDKYPNLSWHSDDVVRVVDGAVDQGIIKLHVRHFSMQNVSDPNLAVSMLWSIPEVRKFAAARNIKFLIVRHGGPSAADTAHPVSLDLQNTTVGEILDKLAAAYGTDPGKAWVGFWTYHSCETATGGRVEMRIF
jgi:hypothetical protein